MGLGSSFYFFFYISTCLIVNVLILTNCVSLQPSCTEQEIKALLDFKHSFRINCSFSLSPFPHPKVNSWIFSEKQDCCSWDGVECDETTGHVIGLDLRSSCLYGSFPPNTSLFELSFLIDLNLSDNHFNSSQIPFGFGSLNRLKSLVLYDSRFSGQIPSDISKLSQLSFLHITNFKVSGYSPILKLHDPTIDKLVQNLTSLQELDLTMVDMSSTFPVGVSNLTSLKFLSFEMCGLYGQLPPNLFSLPYLEVLYSGGNTDLAGSLPEFQTHSPLMSLNLDFTSISGELPSSIGKLAYLEELSLQFCQFSGLLPASLNKLTKLVFLNLVDNFFQGSVPFSLMNLTNLEELDLSNLNVKPGQLFSQLPKLHKLQTLSLEGMKLDTEFQFSLANFTKLQKLDLADSNLKGPFPKWLANLTQLNSLRLTNNALVGPMPQWISQLNNLEFLDLSETNLFVKVDESFFNHGILKFLDLSGTNITIPSYSSVNASLLQLRSLALSKCNLTEFPHFLKFQNHLECLALDGNNIRGSIPIWFVDVTQESLVQIDISNNNLTGFQKPTAVLPWNNLEYMDISNNNFHGQLPIPLNSIKEYLVSSNSFSGNIPHQICNATSLIVLDMSRNILSGQIPHCVANQLGDSLQMLDLRSNNLSGTIPSAFTRFCKLKMINLSNNKLGGKLPRSLVNCSMLEVLDIGRNNVNDSFPSWLGCLKNLQVLVLNHNNFHGIIAECGSSQDFHLLHIIDLSHNHYIGALPSSYIRNWHEMDVSQENNSDTSNIRIDTFLLTNIDIVSSKSIEYSITITNKGNQRLYTKLLKVFRVVDFSSNNFTGKIPDIIGNLQGLQALNLSNNHLHGRIPPSLANISDIESLDLSQNMLSGEIPLALSKLTSLEVFDVSYNQLEGPIPTGNQFNTFDNSSYMGNPKLCGTPLSKQCGIADAPQQPARSLGHKEGDKDPVFIDWIIRSFGFLSGCVIGYVIGKLFITDKYHDWFMETFGRHRLRRRVQRSPRQRR